MTGRLKKVSIVLSIAAGALIACAILFGILNATVGDGQWTLGWNDYRYDDEGYEVGSGSIPVNRITGIEIDWIDGDLQIVSCQDTYPSISERTADGSALPESAQVRWRVDEDGRLSVKYRKSSWFFGFGKRDRDKSLILRIPEKMLDGVQSIDVTVVSTDVTVTDLFADRIAVESKSGEVSLHLPDDASFSLEWTTKSGCLNSDFVLTEQNGAYTTGGDGAQISIRTASGDLNLKKKGSAAENMP